MLRLFLTVLLPLLAPFLIYAAWVWLARRQVAAGARGRAPESWREAPWVWLLATGLACGLAALLLLGGPGGHPAGTKLAPPALVDGEIVPAHPVE